MRIAIVPVVTFPNLPSESEFLLWERFCRVLAKHKDIYAYFLVPDLKYNFKKFKRVHYIKEPWVNVYYDKVGSASSTFYDLFNPRTGKYVIDFVVTSRTAAVTSMSRTLWDYRYDEPSIPIFIDEEKVVDFYQAHQSVTDIVVAARSLGYIFGYPMFDTEVEKKIAIRAATRYLQPAWIKRVLKKAVVYPCGIDTKAIDETIKGIKKEKKFTCFFGGRLNWDSKRAPLAMEIYDKFFAFGRDVKIIVSTPGAKSQRKEFPEIEFYTRAPQREFWKKATSCHTFVSTSRVEGFTVGVVEMLYIGLIGILPKVFWVKGLLKEKFDDYPFLYETAMEAATILRWVHQHPKKAKKKIEWVRSFVADSYSCWKTMEQQLQFMIETTEDDYEETLWSQGNIELMQQTFDVMPNEFNIDDFWKRMVGLSRVYSLEPRMGQITKYGVYKWLTLEEKAQDTCFTPIVELKKR